MKRFGLLGESLGHSYSKELHGLLHDGQYDLLPCDETELLCYLSDERYSGFNVTLPYKKTVVPYCRKLSEAAERIGSVNTLIRMEDGSLFGDNTDYYGFISMAKRAGISFRGEKVLLLGTGGAAASAKAAAEDLGAAEIVSVSRTGEVTYRDLGAHRDAAILVNATPIGMFPHPYESPVDPNDFPHLKGVLDVVYHPLRTMLTDAAKQRGIAVGDGLWMLVAQARKAAERFYGTDRRLADAETVYRTVRRSKENLVLIGMPGCGKSTVGKLLGAMSSRPVIDLDAKIEDTYGMSIETIFERHGEETFRAWERELLRRYGQENGIILVTGGGIVKDASNRYPMQANGRVYHIEREVSCLAREHRPLSLTSDLERMHRKRLPLYRAFADRTVQNDTTPEAVAQEIWRDFFETVGIERA